MFLVCDKDSWTYSACVLVYRCSTLLVVGDNSPAVEAVVDCNSKLNPTKTTLLKVTK